MAGSVVVRSAHRIYGPFADANEALCWIHKARENLDRQALPLAIESLEDPTSRVPGFFEAARK